MAAPTTALLEAPRPSLPRHRSAPGVFEPSRRLRARAPGALDARARAPAP